MSPPSEAALRSFGGDAMAVESLPGGRGLTWRSGGIVLRPSQADGETSWKADVLAALPHTAGFRAPRPIRAITGEWSIEGWEAWQWLPGATDESRVADILAAGSAFHAAVAHLDRPDFLDVSDDAWSRSDRIAWEEERMPEDDVLRRLSDAFRPVDASSQLIHGDLLGTVMFEEGAPPTIIDWAPYWRPTGYASAIVVADAACWHGLSIDCMRTMVDGIPEGRQHLLRALVFRISTLLLNGHWGSEIRARHEAVVGAALDDRS